MADPKDAKKEAPPEKNLLEELVVIIVVLTIFATLFNRLSELFFGSGNTSGGSQALTFGNTIRLYFTQHVIPLFRTVAFVFSVLFAAGIAWTISLLTKVQGEVNAIYYPKKDMVGTESGTEKPKQNIKWERIVSHLNSQSQNDWKFAILEADIMLNDLLDTLNYPGSTMADKLKVVNPGDFKTIEEAWEAHKIRNIIAHDGTSYVLSDREAKRVLDLYKKVFEEFKII